MQNHAAAAYQQTTKAVETPRDREAALLIRAASEMQAVADNWPLENDKLARVLTYNRKLWTIFISSASKEENPLPRQIRENIVNLGIFVLKQTHETMLQPGPQKLGSMININRQLAAGLRGK